MQAMWREVHADIQEGVLQPGMQSKLQTSCKTKKAQEV